MVIDSVPATGFLNRWRLLSGIAVNSEGYPIVGHFVHEGTDCWVVDYSANRYQAKIRVYKGNTVLYTLNWRDVSTAGGENETCKWGGGWVYQGGKLYLPSMELYGINELRAKVYAIDMDTGSASVVFYKQVDNVFSLLYEWNLGADLTWDPVSGEMFFFYTYYSEDSPQADGGMWGHAVYKLTSAGAESLRLSYDHNEDFSGTFSSGPEASLSGGMFDGTYSAAAHYGSIGISYDPANDVVVCWRCTADDVQISGYVWGSGSCHARYFDVDTEDGAGTALYTQNDEDYILMSHSQYWPLYMRGTDKILRNIMNGSNYWNLSSYLDAEYTWAIAQKITSSDDFYVVTAKVSGSTVIFYLLKLQAPTTVTLVDSRTVTSANCSPNQRRVAHWNQGVQTGVWANDIYVGNSIKMLISRPNPFRDIL